MSKKYVRETAAGKVISAYVIMKGARRVAVIQMHHGATCLVNVWQESAAYVRSAKARKEFTDETAAYHAYGFQRATASGYGYDKAASALSGLIIDGHEMTDHCSRFKSPKPPAGHKLFPRDFKAPAGYSLANFASISKATGGRIYRDEWMKRAAAELGLPADSPISNDDFDKVAEKARDLEIAWQSSDDCESGYADCYRESGLKYLNSIGYMVISAI